MLLVMDFRKFAEFLVVFTIIINQKSAGLEIQIPKFLQRNYANVYKGNTMQVGPERPTANPSNQYTYQYGYGTHPGVKSSYGVKTGVKTKTSRPTSGCITLPFAPLNVQVICSKFSPSCQATCKSPQYLFPNGETQLILNCEYGKWQIQGIDWLTIPPCEPICSPPCQNNGICVGPNQCNCPESYSGAQCQFHNMPCLNYPPMPKNAQRRCNSKQCTITCLNGHEFSDGSSIASLVCNNGLWIPAKEKWITLPDCEATCNPPCQNGGKCISVDVCQCPAQFRGSQCQYNVEACHVKKLPTNGGYNCSGDSDSFSCSISCPENVPFEFQPEPIYTCLYSTGIFEPTPIPKCVYPNENLGTRVVSHSSSYPNQVIPGYASSFNSTNNLLPNPNIIVPGYSSFVPKPNNYDGFVFFDNNINVDPLQTHGHNENHVVEQRLPQPGSCFHWGGSHYKTFDGEVYSFESKCSHILARDAVDNTFSIVTLNHDSCYSNAIHCHTVIKIYLQDKQYFLQRSLDRTPIFRTVDKILPIPGQVPGIRVEMSAHHIVVLLDAVGASIRWDGQQSVQVEVKANLWNKTEGLCGGINGDATDDLLTTDGHRPRSIVTLAESWKIIDLENLCDDVPTEEHVCQDTGVKDTLANKATLFCKRLLSDTRFSACQHVVDINSLLDACRWDYCNCNENDRSLCACETLNIYVRDCSLKGVAGLANWRDADTCPMQCTGGKIYKACGPAKGQPGCGAVTEQLEDNAPCVEGCYCPEGTVVHENKCIPREKCPCSLRGRSFPAGTSVPKDCNTCTCNNGQWLCTEVSCGARCSAVGDPHYVTFDGKIFNFMGQCSYYLVKNDNFSIEAENVACAGAISQAMNFPASVSSGLPSCTKTVTIKIGGQTIKLKQNHDVVVNGKDISKLPFTIAGINIRSISSIFLQANLPNGIEVWWDGLTRVYIDVPAEFKEKTRGLCGTFNNNQKDDFLTPEDDIEQAIIPFANKWKTNEKCEDLPEVVTSHPCDKNIHKKPTAEKHCSKIKSDLFKDCHWIVDPEKFYQDCMYDMCSCELQVSRCLCPIVASYANECSRKGAKIDWRGEVRECGVHCPGGQTYQVCGNSCTRTCYDIANNPDCKQQCVEGCNCPEGQTLDDNGECIPIGQCDCQFDGLEFPSGYKEVRPATHGPELCSCVNAVWQCHLATPEEMKDFPRASDLRSKCNTSNNLEFTTCEPAEPITCKNMHSPDFFSASVCHPGCQCKAGYVLDTSTLSCVKPMECPCHHGGRSYKENSTVQNDCNTCTCQNGKWKCTDRQCSAECSSWGDSHYKTFDGKYFDYQGQCDYVLAKGNLELNSFDISIQNVPCGSLGTACSKSVTVKVTVGDDTESITLSKDKPTPSYKTYKNVIVRNKGVFVILEAPEIGLVVHWDSGTRVYVKVDPRWKNRIKGLCGNYNDNDADDFQTPSGGIPEVSANIFGDSWRLQSYCPEALEITDTCQERPDRKVWALKKCGILKSSLFAPCHSEVPITHYYEKCIFDSCACDQGGDCACLCTALAAYAQECNNRGVPIKWRSQELCPMQCDERCSKYSPCISTCPIETCDNSLVNRKLSKTCSEDTCIEGCAPKPCPPGFIFSNSSYLDCIPRNICKPVCLEEAGTTYFEGDLMEEDDCHSCFCSRQQKICKGLPCTPTVTPELVVTHQLEEIVRCKSGWTDWINQDRDVGNGLGKQSDVEPIPSEIIMNNLKESGRCDVGQMNYIECRTVGSHIPAKDTGLDVECSLDKGLVCKAGPAGECVDFEIRIKCLCEAEMMIPETGGGQFRKYLNKSIWKTTTPVYILPETESPYIPVEPETPRCPPGTTFSPCAIECNRLCHYYKHLVLEKGHCQGEVECESGCVSAKKLQSCPNDTLWANDHECVSIDECLCANEELQSIKPGQVYENGCRKCQCIQNDVNCYEAECEKSTVTARYTTTGIPPTVPTMPPVIIPPKTTPPPKCDEDRFINLIQGDQPLPDEAFNASSVLDSKYSPSHARFNTRKSETSAASWSPNYSNEDQYLQIDLGRQEPVYGVIIRGSPIFDSYVTSYRVLYSPDGHTFYYILNKDNYPKIFRGSIDMTTPAKEVFETPVEAKVIRINPQTWNNDISLRVELIGCREELSTTTAKPLSGPSGNAGLLGRPQRPQRPPSSQFCDDPMGIGNGEMGPHQISTSSDLSPEHSKVNLKLNGTSSWQPLTNSPTEWIQFDFLEPRNITGLITKGGEDGWVKAFTVKYSHNKKDWNPILDAHQKEKIFPGNFDSNMPQVTQFTRPINTRYVQIIPTSWQDNIQMRVEMVGCYKPYPVVEVSTTVSPSVCSNCPGVESPPLEMDACRCLQNLWWDGENCVNRTACPCMVGHIPYAVGAHFEEEDCSECTCKLGGVSHCTPKKCQPCKEGLRSTVTPTCACTCQPCPPGTVLCPTSNICINETLWCNGVQDCPDDELNCLVFTEEIITTTVATAISKPKKKCPLIQCQSGYKKVERKVSKNWRKQLYVSQMVSGRIKSRKTYSGFSDALKTKKNGNKGSKQPALQKPLTVVSEIAKEEIVCKEYKCMSTKPPPDFIYGPFECPPAVCQPGFTPIFEEKKKTKSKTCPTYSCYPPLEPDIVCNVTGRTFNTFDGVEYKYDICNHVLARDLENDKWAVSLKKNCTTVCYRDLVIWHQNHLLVIHPDLSLEFDGYKYSVEQTKKIGSQNEAFAISHLGDTTLLFTSQRYGFWITWTTLGDVRLGVPHKLVEKVDGLCGFFNEIPEDDKRKPNGNPAKTSVEFGDSWAVVGDQPAECEARVCPIHTQNQAWEMCSKVKEQPLSACARAVDIEAFISRCLETTCTCLEHALDNHTAEEECRCNAMQNFVTDCLSADSTVDLSDWRMQQDCPTTCESPLVYHDCYQRQCEPTCQSISDPNICPKTSSICFPGCYCPPGYVRKGETCIKPSDCRDCECNILPHLQYVTYDSNNFTIDGNCTYVLSRDIDLHNFQVLVTNQPCKNKVDKACIGKITVLYEGHTLNVLLDDYNNKLQLIVDGKRVSDFSKIARWVAARETATKHIKLLLTAIQVEVSVYYPSLGVSVKSPSHKYGGRLEGLCGNCNGDVDDDIKTPKGDKPKDINDFALSWLHESPNNKEQCQNKVQKDCPPLPVDSNPCVQLVDVNKFGQCLNVLDPSMFIEWCKKDTCGGHPELACAAIEAYARDCANAGFCINWRNEYCQARSCPPEQFYDPCGTSNPETCDSIKGVTQIPKNIIPTEGCYCPKGKVFLNNTCVTPNDCEVCDDEGHHPGDKWQKDKCTTCTCEGTSRKCETQQCSGASTICESGYKSIRISAPGEECCDKYACVLEPTAGPTCETPSQPSCGSGQILKLITKPNGCQTFICECKPIEDCEPVNLTTGVPLEPGYTKKIDDSGCCPIVNLVCKKDLCPTPKNCPEYHSLKVENVDGKCCPLYSCEPPKDKCIYETEFTAADNGGERSLTKFEKQNLLKGLNETWKDGPCRECKCVIGSLGNNQPVCKETECPALTKHPDFAEYQLELKPVFEECCPRIKRSACKFDGKVYNVSEKWSKGTDYCTTYECVKTPTGIQKETQVKSCEKNCDVGSEYVKPTPESKECCGFCKQVACVVDGTEYQVGENWSSSDFCTSYFCVNVNGSLQVQAVVVNCPKLPEDYLNDFVIDSKPKQGDCCPELVQSACKVGDTVYQVGETWPSPDGDKCKTIGCIQKENKELVKQESVENCKTDCAKGWDYQESNETCCGECVQVACVSEGDIIQSGETWKSADNCTTYSCDNLDNQYVISSSQESCPSLLDCPSKDVYFDGCCKRCNITAASQTICSPEAVPLEETIGLINYTLTAHGECINQEPIENFTECVGNCHSSTFFNRKSGLHESVCSCCQATGYTSISVELVCSDGQKRNKKIAVPSTCGCESCAATKRNHASVKATKTARAV